MRIIIAGSRSVTDYQVLLEAVSKFSELVAPTHLWTEIISGGARGADDLGIQYGLANGIRVVVMPADWSHHGKSAGHIRNKKMAEYGDALIALWDGSSSGTSHMISQAKSYNLPYYIHRVDIHDH